MILNARLLFHVLLRVHFIIWYLISVHLILTNTPIRRLYLVEFQFREELIQLLFQTFATLLKRLQSPSFTLLGSLIQSYNTVLDPLLSGICTHSDCSANAWTGTNQKTEREHEQTCQQMRLQNDWLSLLLSTDMFVFMVVVCSVATVDKETFLVEL